VAQVAARIIDLHHAGREGIVGAWQCGELLIDCGPSSSLERLLEGLGESPPAALLLTHVHLDHAGAAGTLVARWPQLPVFVHPRGAPHLEDPSRLVASARRVFGEPFQRLFGEVKPVPAANLNTIEDGQRIGSVECAWTPGHANHHVAFLERDTGLAFPGDIASVKLGDGPVVPPTPPPEIDLGAWRRSLKLLEGWRAQALALPHYGLVERPDEHIEAMREALERHERWAAEGEEVFLASLRELLQASVTPGAADDYMFVSLARPSAAGLRRWLERSAGGTAAGSDSGGAGGSPAGRGAAGSQPS
jgi:glyoxylase-like metal-dependent hydrolase (beta-lactamase superfamily II)